MTRLRWFDRSFDFAFPPDVYPEIIERLRGTPARLAERTMHLAEAVQTRRVQQRWSIRENVGHIADLDEGVFLSRVYAFRDNAAMLPVADLTNATTTSANHNAQTMQEVLARARRARERLVAELEALDAEDFARGSVHPRLLVPMRLVDMMFFVAEHDDHHLATITELARTPV
jgi:uncharacterized damage-inducible protein DinB